MNDNEVKKLITNILIENNIEPTEDIFSKLETYYNMLVEYNSHTNLTTITKKTDVYLKHFADSLLGINIYDKNSTVCDIGTGAGFPGLVLKIARPDLEIYLVDSLNKRIAFLKNVIKALNLTNIYALHYRAEDIEFKKKYLNSFDYVIARAVASMETLTEYCLPYVKTGGRFIAYKSQNADSELELAKKCIETLGGKYYSTMQTLLNNEYMRKLIIIKKLSKTSDKYPRDKNKPRTNPII